MAPAGLCGASFGRGGLWSHAHTGRRRGDRNAAFGAGAAHRHPNFHPNIHGHTDAYTRKLRHAAWATQPNPESHAHPHGFGPDSSHSHSAVKCV